MLEQAIENLKNEFIFIGLEEKQSQSFDLLCATMDWDRSVFPDQIANKFYLDFSDFDDRTRRLASTLVSFDARLYQAAESIFEERLRHYEVTNNKGDSPKKNKPKWFNYFRK